MINYETLDTAIATLPLYHQYEGQHTLQPAYLEISRDGGDITALWDWTADVAPGTPVDVWNNIVLRIPVTAEANADQLNALMESAELRVLVERVATGWETEWDGSNWVGKQTTDSITAMEDLVELLDAVEPSISIWSGAAWLECGITEITDADGDIVSYDIDGIGEITAKTTDGQLEGMGKEIRVQALGDAIIPDLNGYLKSLGNELK